MNQSTPAYLDRIDRIESWQKLSSLINSVTGSEIVFQGKNNGLILSGRVNRISIEEREDRPSWVTLCFVNKLTFISMSKEKMPDVHGIIFTPMKMHEVRNGREFVLSLRSFLSGKVFDVRINLK